jgi:hypothetical protein
MLRNPIPKGMGKRVESREIQVSANYKNFEWKTQISADEGTVDNYLFRGDVKPVAPDKGDLWRALEWLALYDAGDDVEVAQSLANVVAFLSFTADSKEKREVLAEAKRQYAKANGLKVSQVRIKKEQK